MIINGTNTATSNVSFHVCVFAPSRALLFPEAGSVGSEVTCPGILLDENCGFVGSLPVSVCEAVCELFVTNETVVATVEDGSEI